LSKKTTVASGKQIAAWVLAAAALGLSVFALLAWQAVSVQQVEASAALKQFEAVRASVKGAPLVRRDESGRFERLATASNDAPVTQLHVLAYHVSGQRLVRADVPFWFLRAKGPAVQYALRGTDFDLAALNLTPSELQAAWACVVLDEVRPNGDRVLAWTD
jgi:hypothetical protein